MVWVIRNTNLLGLLEALSLTEIEESDPETGFVATAGGNLQSAAA
jgi:hypothetical protein